MIQEDSYVPRCYVEMKLTSGTKGLIKHTVKLIY